MASTNDLRNGMVLNIDGQLWSVVEFQYVKPGKDPTLVRTKIKNVLSGKTVDKTLNAEVKIETATVDRRDMRYLYNDGTDFVFMGLETYEQIPVSPEIVGDAANFFLEEQQVIVASHGEQVFSAELPVSVVLGVTYTEPDLQGDRSNADIEPAKTQTGYEIQVPLFLNQGDKVKIDTCMGEYLGRVTD